jgi:hypothetical protein
MPTNKKGSVLILVLATTGLFLAILLGSISVALLQLKLSNHTIASNQALHIAEAGVNYYRWVLYHDHEQYCNKETCKAGPDYGPYGPYEYEDSSNQHLKGYYELYITPPPANGSTIVNIKSVGWVAGYPNVKKTIEVRCGIPSWSSYSNLCNSDIRFGAGTEVWGPIHSNGGVRFDGISHNLITSSQLKYDDPDHPTGGDEFGVHTHAHTAGTYDTNELCDELSPPCDPLPQDYSDVFMAGRVLGAGTISFSLLDNYANTTYSKATSSGIVFDGRAAGTADPYSVAVYWGCSTSGNSCDEGFHITLKTNNTFDIRGVSDVMPACGNPSNSIQNQELLARNYPIPSNGIIFVKGTIWVDGQISNSRVNIIAFKEPFVGGLADININNDILYTNYGGVDAIGLVAQNDVNIGQYSENDIRIDAALIAKSGRVGRDYYGSSCTNYIRDTITVFGSIATNQRYGFAYTDGTGYHTRNLVYDNSLTFSPPPHFPTTGEYTFISWKDE